MADKTWIGGTTAVAQVEVFDVSNGNIAQNDVWTLTLYDEKGQTHVISYTSDATPSLAEVTANLVSNWNDSGDQEIKKITADDYVSGVSVRLTADTAGIPFFVLASTTSSGDIVRDTGDAAYVANSGPSDYNVVTNYLEGVAPAATDTVYVRGGADDILYGLHMIRSGDATNDTTASTLFQETIALTALKVEEDATVNIGSDHAYLHIDADSVDLKGSGVIWLHVDNCTGFITIKQTSGGAGDGTYGVNLRCDEGAVTTDIYCLLPSGATVGFAMQAGATAADDGDATSINITGGEVHLGTHEVPTVIVDGGAVVYNHSDIATTTTIYEGSTLYHEGFGVALGSTTTIYGTLVYNTSGTLAQVHVKSNGVFDLSQSLETFTITNTVELYGNATYRDPTGRSGPKACKLNDTNLSNITLDLPIDKTWTLT